MQDGAGDAVDTMIITLKKCQTLLAFDIRILSVCVV